MSVKYDEYLKEHINNVVNGYDWIVENLPRWIKESGLTREDVLNHDKSKYSKEEYDSYDRYFYPDNYAMKLAMGRSFDYAWLHHIHNNPHHWQYWTLVTDDPERPIEYLTIPRRYIVEMICDWWAFSWKDGDLTEIFSWYDEHRKGIKILENNTNRHRVEGLLSEMWDKLVDKEEPIKKFDWIDVEYARSA